MLKSLLLALDGSPYSAVALKIAVSLGQTHSAALCGIGILDTAAIRRPEPIPIGGNAYKEPLEQSFRERAQQQIAHFLAEFADTCEVEGIDYETKTLEGHPHEQIAQEARHHDLIVISRETHFHFPAQDRPGDTLGRLAHVSPRPILAAPTDSNGGKGVVIAYDDSAASARSLQLFQLSGLFSDQDIRVISVDPNRKRAQSRCANAVAYLERHGRRVSGLPIASHGRPGEILLAEVDASRPALMVMGCFGHRGLRERLFGTTTEEFLFRYQFPVPIFLYH